MAGARYPRFGYKPRTLFPHHRRKGTQGLTRDAMDGHYFGTAFAVETEAGLVDGRVGGNIDLDQPEHELSPNNLTRDPNR